MPECSPACFLKPDAHEIRRNGAPLELTPREYDVLAYLMRQSGR